jgi:ubiquinone/menaquinone biosynthesis C-methylase UbiE
MKNTFNQLVEDFGNEWTEYDYSKTNKENEYLFKKYFDIFPFKKFNLKKFICLDIGSGSGRWAKILSNKVKHLTLLDPSIKAIKVSKKNLFRKTNVSFVNKSVGNMNFKNNKFDFIYSLGVLHHIPDLDSALLEINKILKKNRPFLLYLYYNMDNKPYYYRLIWKVSEIFRYFISKLPFKIKKFFCLFIAITIYFPLANISKLIKFLGFNNELLPLGQYYDKSFYVMKTDALDRFGTIYEKRYSKRQIKNLLIKSGFKNIRFSKKEPYWHVISYKK